MADGACNDLEFWGALVQDRQVAGRVPRRGRPSAVGRAAEPSAVTQSKE